VHQDIITSSENHFFVPHYLFTLNNIIFSKV
jgi:hypothetical protein